MSVSLIDDQATQLKRTLAQQEFTGNESYDDVMALLRGLFDTEHGVCLKIGPIRGPEISTFNGRSLSKYMKDNKKYSSRHKMYLVVPVPSNECIMPVSSVHVAFAENDNDSSNKRKATSSFTPTESKSTTSESVQEMVPHIGFSALTLLEEIGEGGYSRVYKGKWGETDVAVKKCSLPGKNSADAIAEVVENEVSVHAKLHHPNVVHFFGICRQPRFICIITELMHTSLDAILWPEGRKCHLTEIQRKRISFEMLKGLGYLHTMNVVHGDVKPANILLDATKNAIKICDMGIARLKHTIAATKTTSPIIGTLEYMAPESILDGIKPCKSTDIWAMGGTICETMTAGELWEFEKGVQIVDGIKAAMKAQQLPTGMKALKKYQKVYNIVAGTLSYSSKERPSAEEFIQAFKAVI